jgi:uncharacterized protein (TIGR02757 family)
MKERKIILRNTYGMTGLKTRLDELYNKYNRREFVHPDPLEFLYRYDNLQDREIVGLISSSLAYGRVAQILKSVDTVLEKMKPSPFRFLIETGHEQLEVCFRDFKHRFTAGYEIAGLLTAAGRMIRDSGSLNSAFLENYNSRDDNIIPASLDFCKNLSFISKNSCCSLIPSYKGGSAFKRLNLYLRWMIRDDSVDPGGWKGIDTSKLIIPLDTHMHRISLQLGLTERKQADIKTAIEITESFKKIEKNDPIRYDFALTRIGINNLPDEL